MTSVVVESVSKTFEPATQAVSDVSLTIRTGQFVALLGPSGCGKSTLLRMIAGLERPTSGSIRLDGGARCAFVFQDAHLLPWRNVLGNVALPLELAGEPWGAREKAAVEAIEAVGLADAIRRYPAQLSGGMKMRVSLARALVNRPTLLLLDEPFAALDEITRSRLDEMLRQLWLDRGMTVLFVTHSITEAAFLSERAVVFSRRPARTVLDVPIDLPKNRKPEIRVDPAFARQTGVLFESLRSADGGES